MKSDEGACACVSVCGAHVVRVFDAHDLVADVLDLLERRLRRDRVHQHEALPVLHVQVAHRCELLLHASNAQHTSVQSTSMSTSNEYTHSEAVKSNVTC